MGSQGWSQSTFIQWSNKIYFLDLFEQQNNFDYQRWHLDMYVGQPIAGDLFGWVARSQKYDGIVPVLSGGLQWNLTNIQALKEKINLKTQSFIQVFPLKTSQDLGGVDFLHYFSVPIAGPVSLRGYNQYIIRENTSNLYYPWADLIWSVDKNFDIYGRMSYQSAYDTVFGPPGFIFWAGIRINFAF